MLNVEHYDRLALRTHLDFSVIALCEQPLEAVFYTDFPDRREPVREQDSVEVVDLMLESAGEEAIGLNDNRRAVELRQGRFDIHRPSDFAAYALDAQAALESDLFFLSVFERGIDEYERHDVREFGVLTVHFQVGNALGVMGDIDDREPQVAPDLRRGKAHAVRVGHCFQHFGNEREKAIVDGLDGAALLAEDGIAVLDDR